MIKRENNSLVCNVLFGGHVLMKKLFIPKYIYKYTRFNEYWVDIFQNRRFYMPSPDELNDPFEGQLLPVGSGTAGNSINTAAGKFNRDMERFLKNFRILSFSANIRNKAMWAHYSDQYCGFALQFNTQKNFSEVERVIYRPDYETIGPVTIPGLKKYEEYDPIRQSLLIKSKDWENEEEFRIIKEVTHERGKNFANQLMYYNFDLSDLEGIILGANLDFEDKNNAEKYKCHLKNKQRLLDYAHQLKIPVYYSWTVPIKSKIEFYKEGNRPRFDGSSYMNYIEKNF